jgi:hypothetical protein
MPMNFRNVTSMLAVLMFFIIPIASIAKSSPDENLKVVITIPISSVANDAEQDGTKNISRTG